MAASREQPRVALVTGAASGIGAAVTAKLAHAGFTVAVADIDERGCDVVVGRLTSLGHLAVALPLDVSDSAAVDDAFDRLVAREGRLDVLVNNAGFIQSPPGTGARVREHARRRSQGEPGVSVGTTVNTTDELWRRHMAVMVDGSFFCTRAALRHMEHARRGAIVNVASMGAFTASPAAPHYAAAKAAVVAFTRSVAHEVATIGIRVNAVAPGPTATAIMGTDPDPTGSFATSTAIGRLATPDEIAEVVEFLCSERASFCVGETFTVSGGFA